MNLILVLVLFSGYAVNSDAKFERSVKTLHGSEDPPGGARKTFVFDVDNDFEKQVSSTKSHRLDKRSMVSFTNDTILQKINYLNDTHKQLMVHWVGEGSNVIICLARDPNPSPVSSSASLGPSAVYISYNYGDTYENKTEQFKLPNGTYAALDKFYNHPTYNTHFIFTDVKHKLIYVTTNHGRDIIRKDLNFTPSDVSFHELSSNVFVVLDKSDWSKKLWITNDFGQTFRVASEAVKSFYWVKNANGEQELVVQRLEPQGSTTITYSSTLFKYHMDPIYSSGVEDLFVKGDYLFTTVQTPLQLKLFVSYKLGKIKFCKFDTQLKPKNYYIIDVTSNRALVAVSHGSNVAHLYVSENLDKNDDTILFTLSLEDVLCYFPNNTWHNSWIEHVSEDAFADVYKVEGLTGIYIASRVLAKPIGNNLGPQHLGSTITFDHGRSWRLMQAPSRDVEGQQTSCLVTNGCSLHLSQKFSQLNPDTRTISILSSKSAPGIIVATGVLGRSLKGHYGVYVSTDAGLTWRQTLRDLFFFNMGDHGGILTAVKYFKSRGETRHILYSTDEGETWRQTMFHNEDIRLYGLMTEPGENTTVFTMFGSLPQVHQWIIVKLDLIKAFTYNCTKDDYKTWSPSQSDENRSYVPCVLGQQLTYQRRMPHANCYNGLDFDAPIAMRPCDCDVYDYECDFGFVHSMKPGNCVLNKTSGYDPYKIPNDCKPGNFYNRTKGYRKIQGDVCVDGFKNHYLPDEIPCPINEADDFLLFAQRERISRYNLITKTLDELPVKNLKNVIAIDFDMKRNCVYWADIALDTIGRQCLNSGSEAEILVSSDLASIEGMALDWISNTLYFVDGMRSKIELIRTDVNHSGRMRRTILGPDHLKKPRGIALHPKSGYMFWTDWSTENPSVNRANLDGSNMLQLFGKKDVEWPNGISIDYIAERIYWVDARRDYIANSDLHGSYLKLIVSHEEVVSHPFAVAVFKNNMYWDDWKRNAIFSADKDSFRGVEVLLKQLQGLMDLKVYAHGIQIGTNSCVNSTCPYICVGGPKMRSSCLCPDGMDLKNGKCLCPGGVEPFPNATCPRIGNTCSTEHFTCGNSFCVPKGWRCDGEDDCGDASDEAHCGMQTCSSSYFVCGDGKCLPPYWVCDFDADCADGSDELNCARHNCTDNQFTCSNGRCIASKWRCDGEDDCRDNSDEMNCTPSEPQSCKKEEFQCKSGNLICIPPTWRCDGEEDCRDGSDEIDCKNNTCSEGVQFSCGPPRNLCIYSTWVCDGDKDCPDGRDEKNCSTTVPPRPDTIDQFIPTNGTCHDWMFKCANQNCIPYWWKCDEANDCGDGSDEVGCPQITIPPKTTTTTTYKPPSVCRNNQFRCSSENKCIYMSWLCDGMTDCKGGEDERNCENVIKCTEDQFKCQMDGSCVPLTAICNQHFDCPDGTDELSCDHNLPSGPATPSCSIGYFPCDGSSCYPLATLCDGKLDCKDGYDESNCSRTSRVYQVLQMGVDERGINESTLLLYWWIPTPINVKLEFLPSISKVGDNHWDNKTWTDHTEYRFASLQPYTKYNMTIYVRIQNTTTVFPPAKYYIAYTTEGIPTEPWNVTARQQNSSFILISWNKPVHPNGEISDYQVCWYPPLPPIKLKFSGKEQEVLLGDNFQPNVNYSFYVIAHNKKYQSKNSELVTVYFDGDSDLEHIKDLTVQSHTDRSVILSWKYDGSVEGFKVIIATERPYPKLSPRTTKTANITIDGLAPGAYYYFKVSAYKKNFTGPESFISAVTSGAPLPEITELQGMVVKEMGTTVKLTWERPKDSRKVTWIYGVYYGIDEAQLFEKPRVETSDLSATVVNLEACEMYMFSVGIVGPLGYGPLSKHPASIGTSLNKRAPPKKLSVGQEKDDPLKMRVQWSPSCPSTQGSILYIIKVHEKSKDQVWFIKKQNATDLYHIFNITYGAIYEVSVATDEPNAIYTPAVTYHAPPIMPPYEVKTFVESNGSYVVMWQERNVPKIVGAYKYEVLVSRGNELNETTAERYYVKKSPFVYTNSSANMFTFAVRIKADSGYMSRVSEHISMASIPISGTSLTLIFSLLALGLIATAVLLVVVLKHRRLQNSFARFASSHYNSRSGAATFDDNGLEEEESPHITGFSDDEPLVIA